MRTLFRSFLAVPARVLAVLLLAACGTDGGSPGSSADLSVTVAGPAAIATGQEATYVVTVRNAGPDAAATVVPRLALFAGLSPVAGSAVTVTGAVAAWPALAQLTSGASESFSVTVTAASAPGGTLSARASSITPDPAAGNNDGTATASQLAVVVSAQPMADLVLTFGGNPQGASGAEAPATLRLRNTGSVAAEGTVVELAIPAGVGVSSITPASGVLDAGKVRWSPGSVAPAATLDYSVSLTVPLLSATPLTATATSTTSDATAGNNTATATLRAIPVATYTINGEGAGDNFGWIADNVGDVNGDGIDDVALTAPFNDAGGADAGRAYVHSGATGTLLYRVTGATAGGQLGIGIDVVGDMNGDGVNDIALGAPGLSTNQPGYVLVVSGATGSTLFRFDGLAAGDAAGQAVAPAGDVTGDGIPDLLVSAPGRDGPGGTDVGAVYVVSGANGTLVATVTGTVPGAVFGAGLRTVGDLDGDHVPDFAVGSPLENGGRLRVYSGATRALLRGPFTVPGAGSFGQFWVFSPGDFDQDGVPDIFSADINNGTGGANRGAAFVLSGATGTILRTFSGEAAGDQFGMGRAIGDVTGDGVPDFALAAWRRNEGAPVAGKGYIVDGATGATRRSFASVTAGETFGFDIIGMGDVTGDGLVDYLVTAGQENGTGRAYLIPGVPLN